MRRDGRHIGHSHQSLVEDCVEKMLKAAVGVKPNKSA